VSVYSAGGGQLTQVPVSVGTGLTFTYVHWVKLTALPSAFQGTYIASATDGAVGHGILGVGLSTASGWECAIGQATTNAGCAATTDRAGGWVVGEWVCLAVTFSPAAGPRMYVGYTGTPLKEVTYQAGHAGGSPGVGNVNIPSGSPQLYWGSFLSAGAASIPAHHGAFAYWTRVLSLAELRQWQARPDLPLGAYAACTPEGAERTPLDRSGNKRAITYVSGATVRAGERLPALDQAAGGTLVDDDLWHQTAAGYVALTARTGSAALTLGPLTAAGTGTLALAGASSLTLGLTASGTGALALTGAATALTLGTLTASGAGALALAGAATLTLGPLTASSTGALALAGAAALTVGPLTASGTGALALTGAAALTLTLTATATGAGEGGGTAALTLPLTATATGTLALAGTANLPLGLAAASAGAVALTGTAAVTLGPLGVTAAGALALTGQSTLSLGPLALTAAGTLGAPPGTVTPGTFGPLVAAAARRLGAGVPAATRALGPPTPTAARAFGPPVVSHES
jgi:hypothetical protein